MILSIILISPKLCLTTVLVISVTLAILNGTHFYNVFAESPAFSRDLLIDKRTISDSNLTNNQFSDLPFDILSDSGNIDDEYNSTSIMADLPLDILSATSLSDGRFLNGTLWLSTPIYKQSHLDYVNSNLTFNMFISFVSEPDYVYGVRIQPERDGTWTKVIWENEPYHPRLDKNGYTNKTLQTIHNYTGFFENGNRYIDLTLDLGAIGFPDRYYVNYNTTANYNGTFLNDFLMMRTTVPTLTNLVTYNWPNFLNPLELRAGEEKSVDILVKSTDLYTDIFNIISDTDETDGFIMNFDPSRLYIPHNGLAKTKLTIKAAYNVSNGHYTLPIQRQSLTSGGILDSPINETINVEILPPQSTIEETSKLLQINSSVTAFMPLIITSFVGLALFRFLNKNSSSLISLTSGELIAIDVSVIVGVLIFLTIGGVELSPSDVDIHDDPSLTPTEEYSREDDQDSNRINLTVGLLTASIVYPFAISAIRVLVKGSAEYGIKFMVLGFAYLMVSLVILAFLHQ